MEGASQGKGKGKRGLPKHKKAVPKKVRTILEFRKKDDQERTRIKELLKKDAPARGTSAFAYFAAHSEPLPQKEREEGRREDIVDDEDNSKKKVLKGGFIAARKFSELPLCNYTLQGLAESKYTRLTDIQRAAIPHALVGRDLLGAARTGSGKTLAFVIPVLEKLFLQRWGPNAGVGAIVITPSRELAVQIFDVFKVAGKFHRLSMGLIIGGKDFKHEQETIIRMNIIVGTPGRILQHMDETLGFECPNLQMLVLDEADRLLDMGFSKTLNGILENLPPRQTLLFSATQTKSLQDLARLSLNDLFSNGKLAEKLKRMHYGHSLLLTSLIPHSRHFSQQSPEYVGVHDKVGQSTPSKLVQHVLVGGLEGKVNLLWTFIKTHLSSKILVFLSTCKQVKWFFELFRRLQPGIPLAHLHGNVNQTKRMATYFEFDQKKYDVAARGLDFQKVEWVVQLDCPEDPATYIHRSGRTARYNKAGCALLVLLPSEKKMIEKLEAQNIPVKVLAVNQAKQMSITSQLSQLCQENEELRKLGEKAFITYIRSIWMQKDKEVFNVYALPALEYAHSMGLTEMPKVKFLKSAKEAKNAPRKFEKVAKQLEGEISEPKKKKKKLNQPKEEEASDEEDNEESESESEGEEGGSESEGESESENEGESESESEEEEKGSEEESESEEERKPKKAKMTPKDLKEEEEMALRILEQRKLK